MFSPQLPSILKLTAGSFDVPLQGGWAHTSVWPGPARAHRRLQPNGPACLVAVTEPAQSKVLVVFH